MPALFFTPQGLDVLKKKNASMPMGTIISKPSIPLVEKVADRPIQSTPTAVPIQPMTTPMQSPLQNATIAPTQETYLPQVKQTVQPIIKPTAQPMAQTTAQTTPQSQGTSQEEMFFNSLPLEEKIALRKILLGGRGPRVSIA